MKYMVMECRLSYAIVLDEEGAFRKVANLRYEVGQILDEIVEMREPDAAEIITETPAAEPETTPANTKKKKNRLITWISSGVAVAAACLVLFAASTFFRTDPETFASVYMKINPEVRIDVDSADTVIGLDGVNADGDALIDGYTFEDKQLEPVMDELVDRAIALGFLSEGGTVTVTLDAEDDEWVTSHTESLDRSLREHLAETISITIEITTPPSGASSYGASDYPSPDPTEPPTPTANPSDSEYAEPSAAPSTTPTATPSTAPTSDSSYGVTDYHEPSPEPSDSAYSETDYHEPSTPPSDSAYSESDYLPSVEPSTMPSTAPSDSAYSESNYAPSTPPSDSGYGNSAYADPTAEPTPDPTVTPTAEPTPAPTVTPAVDPGDSAYSEPSVDSGDSGYSEPSTGSSDSGYAEPDDDDSSDDDD